MIVNKESTAEIIFTAETVMCLTVGVAWDPAEVLWNLHYMQIFQKSKSEFGKSPGPSSFG